MSASACPHCGVPIPTESDAAFCPACGKALPSRLDTGPRVVGKRDLASTSAGMALQSEELLRLSKRAARALLAVAIIEAIVATIVLLAGPRIR